MKICPVAKYFQTQNRPLFFLPKRQIFAKSGHTASQENLFPPQKARMGDSVFLDLLSVQSVEPNRAQVKSWKPLSVLWTSFYQFYRFEETR